MADNRLKRESREADTRETNERVQAWKPPEVLPSVADPDPDYSYRWIRIATGGETDARNVSLKLREGWEPVKAADHPEIFVDSNNESERFKDNIVMGGLMLCKAPREMTDQRNAYYTGQANAQMASVDNNLMRESDPRMPIFNDRKSKVTFGNGN